MNEASQQQITDAQDVQKCHKSKLNRRNLGVKHFPVYLFWIILSTITKICYI